MQAETQNAMRRNTQSLKGSSRNYYRWNLGMFAIERQKRILDLGCGEGLYFEAIMAYAPQAYVAVDSSLYCVTQTEALFGGRTICRAGVFDFLSDTFPSFLQNQQFDYVFCFDVLEHIADGERALKNIRAIMVATGAPLLFVRVPALQFLYGQNDLAIGHCRRYSLKGLRQLMQRYSFRVLDIRFHNLFGIVPWYVIGRIMKRPLAVTDKEGALFDSIVPVLQRIERIVIPPIGLSLCCTCCLE